uniref:Transcriptional regulator ATRX isogeny n=1 Tax=Cajanus cajan TaxID=3821 RepID=A0A151R282_CAJCA|nr:Transcriptional regulator ATRX isogeny [Cajanus cajan]
MVIRGEEIGSQVGNIGTNEARENEETSALHCKHDFIFNEEIGIQCRWCGWVATEIKYITPPFLLIYVYTDLIVKLNEIRLLGSTDACVLVYVDSKRSGKRVSSGGVNNTSQFHGDLFDDSGKDSRSEADLSRNDGTVWDLIPDIKQSLYPHQQEGFEFIWTNLEGTTNLAKLKKVDAKREGGCIISHAPGTGKTKLTMVFLQTYLQVFPKCLPVIIAPSNILLTWEDELRKWNIGIPFHNMNNAVLSGKEHGINEIDWFGNQRQNKDAIRMIKLCSWYKEKSILLISYNLYEKLAGGKEKIETAIGKMGKVLPDEKIKQLKLLMNPFVNVHKGSILQKNLPGLRDCVLVLKPDSLQQETLESIECSQNVLNFEHKLALVSVHPSLFLDCSLSKQEESVVDKDKLENLRLNPYVGVKTKFLIEFIRLCDAVNEKVLVFSQFIDTLSLIKDQLESAFNWSVGTEVLYMYGKLDQKQKQSLIHSFNDANSQAKVLLASIKASSEGINLIGASRVVLLDVVWNPSVERQAICRAYRLGQKRVVYTYHLLAQGTPECTKYCKQAEKNRLSELVFSNRNAESDNLKISGVKFEDRVLDIMVQHEKLKGMFGERLVQP